MTDIGIYSTARDMVGAVARREISVRELLELHLERIDATNLSVNAIVSLDVDRARAQALELDEQTASGAPLGPLHGLPARLQGHPRGGRVAHDVRLAAARRLRAQARRPGRGADPGGRRGHDRQDQRAGVGRGLAHVQPDLRRHPQPLRPDPLGRRVQRGAGAALASGMVPLADGSDMGGSLRNPASFDNVVGLRPSVGRVPNWPTTNGWELTSVSGPLARNVEDLALLLSVLAGPTSRSPLSLETPGSSFAPPLRGDLAGVRVALSVDLGGAFAVDHAVADIIRAQAGVFESAGADVVDAHPVLHSADAAFRTLRAWLFQHRFGALLAKHPDGFKPSLRDNIEAGEHLSGADVAKAFRQLTSIQDRMRAFFSTYDVLALPTSQVPPFSGEEEYPASINGETQATYLDWMRSAYLITVTGCPAISVPAGFTPEGWPVGIQLVGPVRGERRLLEIAHAFEQATRVGDRRPTL